MRPKAYALALALLLSALSPAVAGAQNAFPPAISVQGSGEVTHAPDQASIGLEIVTNDPNAATATSRNNATYDALVARLRPLGVTGDALRTTGYGVSYNPRPAVPNPSLNQRYGYVVTRSLSVTTDRVGATGALIDAAIAAGVSDVGAVSFGIKDREGAYRAALALAVADARSQAEALAAAAHVRLGALRSLSPSPAPFQVGRTADTVGLARAAVPTVIPAADLTVRATVSASYLIAP